MAVKVNDSFSEASNTDLDDHTPNTVGNAWVQIVGSGTDKIRCTAGSGTAVPATTTASEYQTNTADNTLNANQKITANVKPGATAGIVSIYARCDGTVNNRYRLKIAGTGGVHEVSLEEVVGGSTTEIGTYTTSIANTSSAEYILDVTDAWKRVYIDGTLRINVTNNGLTSGQRAGVRASGSTSVTFYDLILEDGITPASKDLVCRISATAITQGTANLVSSITVRKQSSKDLVCRITGTGGITNATANLVSRISIFQRSSTNLTSRITSLRQSSTSLQCQIGIGVTGPTTHVFDTFGTDYGFLEAGGHSPDIGSDWVKVTGGAGQGIECRAATPWLSRAITNSTARVQVHTNSANDAPSGDIDVSAEIKCNTSTPTSKIDLLGRCNRLDGSTYILRVTQDGTYLDYELLKRDSAGVETSLGTYTVGTDDRSTALIVKLEIRDSAKKVYVAGVERISSADNTQTTGRAAGIQWQGAISGTVDDFLFQSPAISTGVVNLVSRITITSPSFISGGRNFSISSGALVSAGAGVEADLPQGPMSIVYHLKQTYDATYRRGVSKGDASGFYTYHRLEGTQRRLGFTSACFPTPGEWEVESGGADATWQHVVWTYDGSSLLNNPACFVEKVAQPVTQIVPPVGTAVSDSTDPLIVGNRFAINRNLNGKMRHVQIFNRILSQTEIDQLYLKPGSISDGLVINLPLVGDTSPEPDLSDLGNPGSVTSATDAGDSPSITSAWGLKRLVARLTVFNRSQANLVCRVNPLVRSNPFFDVVAACVGFWKMNEASWNGTAGEVVDSSGQGNHGVSVNGATTTATAKLGGRAGNFDGTNDYVSLGSSGTFVDNPEGSFVGWIRFPSTPSTASYYVLSKSGESASGGYKNTLNFRVDSTTGVIRYRVYGNTPNTLLINCTGSTSLLPNTWYFVVLTVSTLNGTKLYLNGVEETLSFTVGTAASHIWFSDVTIAVNETFIGAFREYTASTPIAHFSGQIDNAQLFNRALTADEITALYNKSLGTESLQGVGDGYLPCRILPNAGRDTKDIICRLTVLKMSSASLVSRTLPLHQSSKSLVCRVSPIVVVLDVTTNLPCRIYIHVWSPIPLSSGADWAEIVVTRTPTSGEEQPGIPKVEGRKDLVARTVALKNGTMNLRVRISVNALAARVETDLPLRITVRQQSSKIISGRLVVGPVNAANLTCRFTSKVVNSKNIICTISSTLRSFRNLVSRMTVVAIGSPPGGDVFTVVLTPTHTINTVGFPLDRSNVPFPKGVLASMSNLRLETAAGVEVPCHFREIRRWQDNSIAVVELVLVWDGVTSSYNLKYGSGVSRSTYSSNLTYSEDASQLLITTGKIRTQLLKSLGWLFKQVWIDSNADNTYVDADRIINLSGGADVERLDSGGTDLYKSSINSTPAIQVEESNVLRIVVKHSGKLAIAGPTFTMGYEIRYYLYRESNIVFADVRLFDDRSESDKESAPQYSADGSTYSGMKGYVSQRLSLQLPYILGSQTVTFGTTGTGSTSAAQSGEQYLLQWGRDNVNNWFTDEYYLDLDGMVEGIGHPSGKGAGWYDIADSSRGITVCVKKFWERFPHELQVQSNNLRIGLHPQRASDKAAVGGASRFERPRVHYMPRQGGSLMERVCFQFHTGAHNGVALNTDFQNRPRLTPSAAWLCASKVYGNLIEAGVWSAGYDDYLLQGHTRVYTNRLNLGGVVPGYAGETVMYGKRDQGCTLNSTSPVPMDGAGRNVPINMNNTHVGLGYLWLVQYIRTLNFNSWGKIGFDTCEHWMEYDVAHSNRAGDTGGIDTNNLGAGEPYTEFHNDGQKDHTNRQATDNHINFSGLPDYYLLTSDRRCLDVINEVGQWCVNYAPRRYGSSFTFGETYQGSSMEHRDYNWVMWMLLEAFRATGDVTYLNRAAQCGKFLMGWFRQTSYAHKQGIDVHANSYTTGLAAWYLWRNSANSTLANWNGGSIWMHGGLIATAIDYFETDIGYGTIASVGGFTRYNWMDCILQNLESAVRNSYKPTIGHGDYYLYDESRNLFPNDWGRTGNDGGGAPTTFWRTLGAGWTFSLAYGYYLLKKGDLNGGAGLHLNPSWFTTQAGSYSLWNNLSNDAYIGAQEVTAWGGGGRSVDFGNYGYYGYELLHRADFFRIRRDYELNPY